MVTKVSREERRIVERLLKRAVADRGFRKEFLNGTINHLTGAGVRKDLGVLLCRLQGSDYEELGIDIRPYREILREDGYKCVSFGGAAEL